MPDLSKVTAILPDLADYVVYGAIAVVTLIGLFKCLIPLWRTTASLRRAIVRLQQNAGKQLDKPVWQEARFVGRRLKGSWLRFLQNAEQLDRRGLPTNVEDYINDDTVTHGPGNAGLAELIPNLLTSLGILGTFMGLSRGLSSLNFADSTQLIQGIPDLLSGMRFAFGTSVAGISCSLIFNMLNRISQGSSYRAIDDFVTSFTQLAMSRPLDNDVQMIIQNQDRNFMLQGINEALVDRLADSVSRSISMTMSPVAESMDRFIVGTTRNQIEGVNHIVSRFLSEMDRSLGNQFSSLSKTMGALEQSQIRAAQATGENLTAAEGIVRNARSLQEITSHALDQFDSYMTRIDEVRDRDENFEKNASELLRDMRQESRDMSSLLSGLTEKMQGLSAPGDSAADKKLEEIRSLMSTLNDHVLTVSDTLARLSEEA
ncbi:MAG: hypothetical protein K6F61_12130 [Clostridiales bacterium]|nr:hypothetical protein [Clostridia bacterium]MCR5567592.1 hypothetical protein [Clostridiales bacterium]